MLKVEQPVTSVDLSMDQNIPSRSAAGRWHWLPLASILLLALAMRAALFAVAWFHTPDLTSLRTDDTQSYVEPAQSLFDTGTFSCHSGPELQRTPGYPLLLLLGISLGHMAGVTVAMQMLLSVATVWLAYRLALMLTDSRTAALAAGLFMAIEPLSIIYTPYLMSETLFTFLFVLTITALTRYFRSESLVHLTLAAALLAAATFVRPISYFLPPVITLVVLGRDIWQSGTRWRCVRGAGIFLAVSVIPLAAWQARNAAVAGYTGFSAISDSNLYFYQSASVLAHLRHQSLAAAQIELGTVDDARFYERHPELKEAGQAATLRFMHREGVRILSEHPAAYAKIHLRGMALLALNPAGTDMLQLIDRYPENRHPHKIDAGVLGIVAQMHREAPLVLYTNLLLAIGLGFFYLAAAFGLVGYLGRWNWDLTLFVLIAGYMLVIAGGPASAPRLRHPVMPLLCVLSGIGAAELLRWRAARRRGKDNRSADRQEGKVPLIQHAASGT